VVNNEPEPNAPDKRLASLADFLKQLYVAGGIPLVVIGLGAANMFLPYGDEQRWVVAIVLIAIGTLSWVATVYVTLLRWRVQAQIIAEQDATILRAACEIARSEASDVVPAKIDALRRSLKSMGIRSTALVSTEQLAEEGS